MKSILNRIKQYFKVPNLLIIGLKTTREIQTEELVKKRFSHVQDLVAHGSTIFSEFWHDFNVP